MVFFACVAPETAAPLLVVVVPVEVECWLRATELTHWPWFDTLGLAGTVAVQELRATVDTVEPWLLSVSLDSMLEIVLVVVVALELVLMVAVPVAVVLVSLLCCPRATELTHWPWFTTPEFPGTVAEHVLCATLDTVDPWLPPLPPPLPCAPADPTPPARTNPTIMARATAEAMIS